MNSTASRLEPLDDPAFTGYGPRFMTVNATRYSMVLLACVLAWWPIDFLLFDDRAVLVSMALFRVAMLVVIGAVFAVPGFRRVLVSHPATFAAAWMSVGMFLAAYAVGHTGSLEDGWAHYFCVGIYVSVVMVGALGLRVQLATALTLAGPAGFFLARPEDLSSPGLPSLVLFYALAAFLAVITGHAASRRIATHFDHERELEAQARELDLISQRLENLVIEQTQELRELALRLHEAQDAERRWMAAEMHDGLGQEVASLGYSLAFVRRTGMASADGKRVLVECRGILDAMNDSIGVVLERLRPETVEKGLETALQELVASLAVTWPLRPVLRVRLGGAQLSADVALAAYRVVQEGLGNALKHARASRVEVTVTCSDGQLTLEVRDDGVGFDLRTHTWTGFGLSGIQGRVATLGGLVRWERGAHRGTTLSARLPVSSSRKAAGR